MKQINNILTKSFLEKKINLKKMTEYDEMLGVLKKYVNSIEQFGLKSGIISIEVISNVQRYELTMRKNQILLDLKSSKIKTKIKDIKIVAKGMKIY